MEFTEFLDNNSAAVFALLGAAVSGIISLATAWVLRRYDYSLRLWEKISERRIKAHEELLEPAMQLRTMVMIGDLQLDGEALRTPQIMLSRENFEEWFRNFSLKSVSGSAWQSINVKREANFIQDYFSILYQTLFNTPPELYPNVGIIIRQDFIDLSDSFEKELSAFFSKDVRKLQASAVNEWHKIPLEETNRRLLNTELGKNRGVILDRSHNLMGKAILT